MVDQQTKLSEIHCRKRLHAKQLIERYFYQLTKGCGFSNCKNKNCASNSELEALTPNQAAARAIKLFSEDTALCISITSKTESHSELAQIFGCDDKCR